MKLFFYCRTMSRGKGGTERVVAELANDMVRRGHEVFLAYRSLLGEVRPAYPTCGEVRLIPVGEDFALLRQLRDVVVKLSPDVVLGFYANPLVFESVYLAEETGIPLALQECSNPHRVIHDNWKKSAPDPTYAALEREAATSGACRIRLTQPNYAQSFPEYLRRGVRAFPNAFSNGLPPARDAAKKYLLHIGGYKEHKNLLPLLQAFARLKDDFPQWEILVFSTTPNDVSYRDQCFRFAEEHGLMERVHFNGATDDVAVEYARSSIHVMTSMSEGLPNCVCEAMTHGVPTVGYADSIGTNTLVQHEINGLLAAGDDHVGGMEEMLRRLMADDALRERLGAQAREDSAMFEPRRVYDTWESFLKEAADYKRKPGKLIYEQAGVDSKRAVLATKMRHKCLARHVGLPF